jgi:hypothetical protein
MASDSGARIAWSGPLCPNKLPEEMKNDRFLNKLHLCGSHGPDHEKLRKAYYAIRDNKPVDMNGLEKTFELICHKSPELLEEGRDDTHGELIYICRHVGRFLAMQNSK